MTAIVHTLVAAFTLYLAAGFVFAVAFVTLGVQRIDSQAHGASLGFRLIILPGSAALWPFLLVRWLRHAGDPPVETNAHRRAALSADSK